ncbi:MAG: family 10 glycosylhydrolase [Muribaculaceae bacterium]|nr:family 10 glycosylhydrolase [Muribaculaceae bacterium]
MMKKFLLLLVAFAVTAGISVNADEALKREMRAAWVATVYRIDWPTSTNNVTAQKNELNAYLDKFQTQNINTIFLQVRTMCDAFYKSSYEPWSSYLTGTRGKDPGYDPLEYAVEQCHARGIQCHAWINPYRWSTGTNWNTAQDQELKNSGMLLAYTSGSTTTTILNPGLPATRERIVNVIREIITNYDVDGIVFDDYFYPNGIPSNSSAGDYTLWQQSGSGMTIGNWRRNNVNLMVADVYNMIQEVKPEVRFGISPAGVAGTANTSASQHNVTPCPTGSDWQYNGIFSDPLAWLEQGTIDYISPQLYWKTNHSTNPFGPLTQWWSYVANHFGRHHYASHSISFLASSSNTTSDWAEVTQQINYSRQYTENNAPGVVLYSAKNINGNNGGVSGLGNYLLANAFQHPSMIPAVTWKTAPGYNAPANLAQDESVLTWTPQEGTLVKYSVYAVPSTVTVADAASSAFDGIKSDYLLGITYSPTYTLPSAYLNGYWYAVCVIDGYGNESEPSYLGVSNNPEDPNPDQPTPVTYNIEKVWEINDLSFLTTADTRQGFGMNGKFYINDKNASTILVVDQNGLTGTTFEGGSNVGFTRDEAGNLVVSNAPFPDSWTNNPEIKVINPETGEVVTYTLPTNLIDFGRSDNMGFPRGNLMEDGELYLVGANSGTSICRIKITDGEIDTDESFLANCDDVNPNSGTVLNYYTDLNGNDAILYVNRSSTPKKLAFDGDDFTAVGISLPNKGNNNGAFPFIWDGKELVVYPTLNNYLDGFAIAQANASDPIAYVQQTVSANANSYQANWLNAEIIDSRHVTIYQYYPGGHITVWLLTKNGGILRGDVDNNGSVDIADVTALIDYLLSGNSAGINLENADCNFDEGVNIADVTTLIDRLLNGSW